MSLSNSIKYSLSNSHIMTILNRSSHKDSKKSLFAPIKKETMFGIGLCLAGCFLGSSYVQIDEYRKGRQRLHGRGLDRRTFIWTRIKSAYVQMDEDQIGVRLAGRGLDRRTYTHTYIHTHIHTHSYIYKLNIISLYINSLNKLTPNLHQLKYHNLQFKKFTQKINTLNKLNLLKFIIN